jgi:hypothetical protein
MKGRPAKIHNSLPEKARLIDDDKRERDNGPWDHSQKRSQL